MASHPSIKDSKNIIQNSVLSCFLLTRVRLFALLVAVTLSAGGKASAFTLDAGVSLGSISFVADEQAGKQLGEMNEELGLNAYVATRFKQNDNVWGNWGYFVELGFGTFNIDTQLYNDVVIDLGTHVYGEYAYLTWVWYYKHRFKGDAYFAYGLGLGLGYLSARGDVVLTEASGMPTIDVDDAGLSTSYGIYLEYHRNHWFFRIASYGPRIEDDLYQYGVSDNKFIIGRRFFW